MKNSNLFTKFLPLFFLSGFFLFISCETDSTEIIEEEGLNLSKNVSVESEYSSKLIEGQYIVEYNNAFIGKLPELAKVNSSTAYKTQMRSLKSIFVNEFNLKEDKIVKTYGHSIKGFAAKLTKEQVAILIADPRVKSVEQDAIISLGKPSNPGNGGGGGGGGGNPPSQEIPYGTSRVGGGGANTTSGNTAWVIDSGIDLDHPDLNVDVARSISFLTGSPSNRSPEDKNGHGTHVAGTIAAINNSEGSVGVAPGSTVVAVRVLDKRGSGSISGVIAGVDYVGANGNDGDVANMSLGGGASSSLDNAVVGASSSVKFTLAAGNASDDANNHSPARANGNNIYTISAMDSNDNWAYFSNYGNPPVDYCAPGVAIYSTWKDGGYNTISGTSMAAPHAAGVLLLGNAGTDGTVTGDPDNNADLIITH